MKKIIPLYLLQYHYNFYLQGDSGGPFACPVDGQYRVQGVVSVGSPQGNLPSTYTDVYYYKSWIDSVIN